MKWLFITLLLILTNLDVYSHRPRIVKATRVIVDKPCVSQAFYGELKGESHVFYIEADSAFNLFVNILVPDIQGARKDFNVRIVKEGLKDSLIAILSGNESTWKSYYEEFVGDDYLIGPAFTSDPESVDIPLKGLKVQGGKYKVEVYNQMNLGKYVLAIGETEEWPLSEIWLTIRSFPELKRFFLKSPFLSLFETPTLVLFEILMLGIIFFLVLVGKRIWKFSKG